MIAAAAAGSMGLMDAPKEPNERIIASCAAYACACHAANPRVPFRHLCHT